jgi:putative membrane protein
LNGSRAALAILYCKGIAMGLGDSVPGVSGGTIAVITRIYDELIYSIRSVDERALGLVFRGQIGAAWKHVNGNFLLTLALGILSGLLVSANTVLYLLEYRFEALMGFFIGLVMASSVLLFSQFDLARPSNLLALFLGCTLTTGVGLLEPAVSELSLVYLFFCGLIAICAMILPGLSGAFILLLLGAYEHMLTALTGLQWAVIAVFISGCIVGLLAFSRLLALALRRFHELSYGFITGLLLGSLSVLWPWQRPISYYMDSDGQEQVLQTANVWPLNYTEQTGLEPQSVLVAVCMILGLLTVFGLNKVFASRST